MLMYNRDRRRTQSPLRPAALRRTLLLLAAAASSAVVRAAPSVCTLDDYSGTYTACDQVTGLRALDFFFRAGTNCTDTTGVLPDRITGLVCGETRQPPQAAFALNVGELMCFPWKPEMNETRDSSSMDALRAIEGRRHVAGSSSAAGGAPFHVVAPFDAKLGWDVSRDVDFECWARGDQCAGFSFTYSLLFLNGEASPVLDAFSNVLGAELVPNPPGFPADVCGWRTSLDVEKAVGQIQEQVLAGKVPPVPAGTDWRLTWGWNISYPHAFGDERLSPRLTTFFLNTDEILGGAAARAQDAQRVVAFVACLSLVILFLTVPL